MFDVIGATRGISFPPDKMRVLGVKLVTVLAIDGNVEFFSSLRLRFFFNDFWDSIFLSAKNRKIISKDNTFISSKNMFYLPVFFFVFPVPVAVASLAESKLKRMNAYHQATKQLNNV